LMDHGARIRAVKHLHAKLYLFGKRRAIVTSANLTEAALARNHELGYVVENAVGVAECRSYFDDLWRRAGKDLSRRRLTKIEERINRSLAGGARRTALLALGDEGVSLVVDYQPDPSPPWASEPVQSIVKFFGRSGDRAARSMRVIQEVQRSGSHWACTYPRDRRPRRVQDGAVMFLGRLVRDPADILVVGRAVGIKHIPGEDDASPDEVRRRPWKRQWPHYVRVHHAEFVAGELGHGVSLYRLMEDLGSAVFATTQRHALAGSGNVDPRHAYMRQPDVVLSLAGHAELNARLQRAFTQHGRLDSAALARLDWPDQ
jgi:hypothetical protein